MTLTVQHPRRQWRTDRAATVAWIHHPIRAAGNGLLIMLLAAWAGIATFVGPAFGYRPTSQAAWQWTTNNWLLHLLPGAAALVGGLLILGSAPTLRARPVAWFGVLLVVASAAWLVIGPVTWRLFESSQPFRPGTPWRTFLYQVGANLGPGVLLAVLGGMALKAGAATGLTAEPVGAAAVPAEGVPAEGVPAEGAPVGTAPVRTAPVETAPVGTGRVAADTAGRRPVTPVREDLSGQGPVEGAHFAEDAGPAGTEQPAP